MRIAPIATLVVVAAAAHPAAAQTAVSRENVKAEDVALSPLSDVNIRKKEIPAVLEAAIANPYGLAGLKTCAGYATAIESLDAALGDDIDVADEKTTGENMGNSAGTIAKTVIGSFIPFRGVIRELSGANAQQRAWERAVYAGAVRRAFLKGVGQSKGCAYPARAATPQVVAMLEAQRLETAEAKKRGKTDLAEKPVTETPPAPTAVAFESREVVQPVPGARR